jgi:hypothetical protein
VENEEQSQELVYFRILLYVLLQLRENVPRLRPELWPQRNWLLHHDNTPSHTSFFTKEFFYQKQHDCLSHPSRLTWPTATSLFPRLQIKLKGRHFDTIEVIEAESQAVPNTLSEHDLQDEFKICQRRWELCIRAEGDCFEVDCGH